MRRLLLLTPDYPPAVGGIQLLLGRLASELSSRFEITVVTRRADGTRPGRDYDERSVVWRSMMAGRAGVIDANALGAVVGLTRRFDVVLCGHVALAPAALALWHSRRIPFVQYLHADEVPHRADLARRAMLAAASTIAVSRHTRDLALAAGCPEGSLRLVPPGADMPNATNATPPPDAPPTIITVARLEDRYKGHDVMLEAMPAVLAHVPDARWVIVGDGSLRSELEARATTLGIADHVVFAGRVPDAERNSRLAAAHVFAMPSRLPPSGREGGEGFGIVYLEAGLHGLPVVAGNVGGSVDAVVDGETGVLVDPTDPAALADALAGLLLDRERARRVGAAGEARARSFTWERMAQDVATMLESAIERAH